MLPTGSSRYDRPAKGNEKGGDVTTEKSDEDCEREWNNAYRNCEILLNTPGGSNARRGCMTIDECARMRVSVECDGDAPSGAKGKKS
jgi:hypothetical protein